MLLAGSVFVSGGQTYFVQSREIWRRTKSDRRLNSLETGLFKLQMREQWRKIGLVRNGIYGAVYANGDKVYYFDALGTRQLIDSSVYEITDVSVVEILTRPYDAGGKNLNSEDVRKMIKDGRLVAAQGELVFEAVSYYNEPETYIFWIFWAVAFLLGVLAWAVKALRGKSCDFIAKTSSR